ncbi:SPFH/Band 7/PHB domain protein [Gordonia pseudamarae]|jgi:regulator of protease activity HflC (stomatin/prohibitin superfamily)|uniref:SPFH/Band 7/PHB domain protein n=1 Tax=Gordonia pseudamarae TaxID=2831662 RepID=A0ABX6IJ92_9ACTN|nr:SPFH domain-containing protein [Gordonia pseudamarae]MBD0021345.1 SPFH/Band 7/PHB domain protein [Gordonia sp. (in: high G+C Gram-positive bacteria)]QHN26480.1 SPFH/Band 7/PHB domain protein [Gordonia pseudamarae]QHN35375.1 SPFH/Band 7/PHB domain protein [Gordonia pseudamarae]
MEIVGLTVLAVLVLLVATVLAKSIALIPQAEAAVIERLGRYTRTVSGQLTLLVPFIDTIRARVDIRERVVSFPPQPVITEDNLTLSIDTVVYFQVTNPRAAVYEINDYIIGVEQLTITTLRNVVGGMTLEETLTSRDSINGQLRGVLDEATGRWGLRVARVELKSIMPPPSIQESMEKQMKADREKRATILWAEGQRESAIKTAEGNKQSQILAAEGAKQAAILEAEADRQSRILRAQGDRAAAYLNAQGQAKAIEKTFAAIRSSKPTPEVLAYQYLQQLPEMAKGEGSKVWVVPSDFGSALQGFARSFAEKGDDGVFRYQNNDEPVAEVDESEIDDWFTLARDPEVAAAVAEAEAVARTPVDEAQPARRSSGRDRRAVDTAAEQAQLPSDPVPPARESGFADPQFAGRDHQPDPGSEQPLQHQGPPAQPPAGPHRQAQQGWDVQSGGPQPAQPYHGPQQQPPYQVPPRSGYPLQGPGQPGPGQQGSPRR